VLQSTILVLPLAWFWVRMPSKLEQIGLAHSRGEDEARSGVEQPKTSPPAVTATC
jgi:hypothetical protein